ncbi:helix-turn-helix domain-containing protein [Pseudooceanicola sp. MF1-13]|uniref:helix-turn-helix domain-containing protein n=1 Tax=Pseudooceanicola sp. MF1-13 TaxID=3379095 RepID=UPI003891411A
MSKEQPTYINVKEVCEMTGLGETFVRISIATGDLPAFKVGKNVRLRRSDVREWMERKSAA